MTTENIVSIQGSDNKLKILGFVIERTSKRMKQFFQRMLKEAKAGITVDQWIILQLLEKESGISQLEIAQQTYKDAPTVTRIIDLLVGKDLLKRVPDEEDRRRFKIHLTDEGYKKIEEVLPLAKQFRARAWNGLSEQDKEQLTTYLNQIFKNLA